jgi:uncharacterized protein (DUF2384 family)
VVAEQVRGDPRWTHDRQPAKSDPVISDLTDVKTHVRAPRLPAGRHRELVSIRREIAPRRQTEERLLELKAVLDLATRLFRPDVARVWMRSPVPALDYAKPLDLVRAGQWRRVVDELLALSEGVTA